MSEKNILEGFDPGPAEVDEFIRRNQYSPEFAIEELSMILNGYLNETFIGHTDVWEYILPLLKKTVVLQGGCKVLDGYHEIRERVFKDKKKKGWFRKKTTIKQIRDEKISQGASARCWLAGAEPGAERGYGNGHEIGR